MSNCLKPVFLGTAVRIPVPCGKCPPCRLKRAQGWIFRLVQEEKTHSSAQFVTLTYADGNCDRTSNGFLTLSKRHVQLFFKSLRNDHYAKYGFSPRIKYFAVGEYGSDTSRPHYHVILFGADTELVTNAWRDSDGVVRGFVHFGDVNSNSIAYCTKYVMKPGRVGSHARDDRIPEFQLSSKGLGVNYINERTISYHHADLNRNYVTELGGVKVPMPRYYRDKIFSEEQRAIQRETIREVTLGIYLRRVRDHLDSYGNLTSFVNAMSARVSYQAARSFINHNLKRNKL